MAELSDYLNSLELFRDYPVGERRFVYRFVKEPEVVDHMKMFRIEEVAGNGDTFSKARKVMQWVADLTQYDGASPLGLAMPEQIIEFGIKEKQPINCLNRSMLFGDALHSVGIFAFPVFLGGCPYIEKEKRFADDGHSHVIAQVWLPERECWATFDPSFNTYFVTYEGRFFKRKARPVSIGEMATKITTMGKIVAKDNRTGRCTQNGFLCTQIGLIRIAVFPGSELDYRKSYESFDKQLTIVPQSYIERLRAVEGDLQGWKEKLVNAPKITLNDLEGAPEWSEGGDSCG